jgi:hypothetical protein
MKHDESNIYIVICVFRLILCSFTLLVTLNMTPITDTRKFIEPLKAKFLMSLTGPGGAGRSTIVKVRNCVSVSFGFMKTVFERISCLLTPNIISCTIRWHKDFVTNFALQWEMYGQIQHSCSPLTPGLRHHFMINQGS